VTAAGKACDCYLGLLFTMEDVAVYGYITPLKVKIIVALPLTDSVVKDVEITAVSLCYLFEGFDHTKRFSDIQSISYGLLFINIKSISKVGQFWRWIKRTVLDHYCRESQVEVFQAPCR
jgi:hypothetical protein